MNLISKLWNLDFCLHRFTPPGHPVRVEFVRGSLLFDYRFGLKEPSNFRHAAVGLSVYLINHELQNSVFDAC